MRQWWIIESKLTTTSPAWGLKWDSHQARIIHRDTDLLFSRQPTPCLVKAWLVVTPRLKKYASRGWPEAARALPILTFILVPLRWLCHYDLHRLFSSKCPFLLRVQYYSIFTAHRRRKIHILPNRPTMTTILRSAPLITGYNSFKKPWWHRQGVFMWAKWPVLWYKTLLTNHI
jgi:hypothetical protein